MIKLDIQKYCFNCTEFEPEVTDRPNLFYCGSRCINSGDTVVKCEKRYICENLYQYMKGENDAEN